MTWPRHVFSCRHRRDDVLAPSRSRADGPVAPPEQLREVLHKNSQAFHQELCPRSSDYNLLCRGTIAGERERRVLQVIKTGGQDGERQTTHGFFITWNNDVMNSSFSQWLRSCQLLRCGEKRRAGAEVVGAELSTALHIMGVKRQHNLQTSLH